MLEKARWLTQLSFVVIGALGNVANAAPTIGYAEYLAPPTTQDPSILIVRDAPGYTVGTLLGEAGLLERIRFVSGGAIIAPAGQHYTAIGFDGINERATLGAVLPLELYGLETDGTQSSGRQFFKRAGFGDVSPISASFSSDIGQDLFRATYHNHLNRPIQIQVEYMVFAGSGLLNSISEIYNLDPLGDHEALFGGCAAGRCFNDEPGPLTAFLWGYEVGSNPKGLRDTFGGVLSNFTQSDLELRSLRFLPEPRALALFGAAMLCLIAFRSRPNGQGVRFMASFGIGRAT